jgi:hypothetical protein
VDSESKRDPAAALHEAWDDLIAELQLARDALEDPAYHPAPPTDRNLGEGYRHLLGHLHRLLETETHQDPDFPYFQRHPWTISKYTIENPDCLYLYAPVDPDGVYRIRGRAARFDHWRGERVGGEKLAPHYVLFETHTMAPGDSGGLAELVDGSRAVVGMLDSTKLAVEPDGSFEIVLAASRPPGHEGNFIPTRAKSGELPQGSAADHEQVATKLYVRELFGDWENEEAVELEIVRVGNEGGHPSPRSAASTAAQLRRLGELMKNQLRFWNLFYGVVLDPFGQSEQKRPSHLPRNGMMPPRPANLGTGGGQATNFFSGGIFDLREDQALVVEARVVEEPVYIGMHLGNFWGESFDYANHVTSINQIQAHRDADGAIRYVVARRDPGVANWLDTTGHVGGYMTIRFTYPETPPEERHPSVSCKLVNLVDVRANLPPDTPIVSPEARRRQIIARQMHVARRYRQY